MFLKCGIKRKSNKKTRKKFKDAELEAILEEDPCQTQEKLADAVGADHSTVFKKPWK